MEHSTDFASFKDELNATMKATGIWHGALAKKVHWHPEWLTRIAENSSGAREATEDEKITLRGVLGTLKE